MTDQTKDTTAGTVEEQPTDSLNRSRIASVRPNQPQGNNEQRRADKIARMRRFVDTVVQEYRQDKITLGLWRIAESQGIPIGTLNSWYSDPDFEKIAQELKTVRKLVVEDKITRAIVNGEGVTMISNLIGYLNRLDPVAQKSDLTLTHVSIGSGVRADMSSDDIARVTQAERAVVN